MPQRLSPDDIGLQLLENSTATAAGLVALILAFGAISGAHLNPVVSLADRVFGGLTARELLVYLPAQVVGAVSRRDGGERDVRPRRDHVLRPRPLRRRLLLGEVVATFGLVLVIVGVVRSGRAATVPFAVAGYIAAAYWFTSSTSFANPAVTIGRTLTDTFAGISPSSAPAFIGADLVGGLARRSRWRGTCLHVRRRLVAPPRRAA